ncbi:MAG: 8-oxo-dGTP diphosphatase MutT [Acidobacteria bacterium]|nr:8-oxo-dGTP diphosphatase MutT [Acidobacteriota bacterium]
MKPTVEVAAAIVFREGRLLITQRLPDSHLSGLWELPGGKRKSGESIRECLEREMREELNIRVVVGELVDTIEYDYSEKTVCLKFFRCRYAGGDIQALGCRTFAWVTPDELGNYRFPPANRSLMKKLRSWGVNY